MSIARCGTGTVHLQMGPLPLSLTPNEFAEVAAVVVCAIERLERARGRVPDGGCRPFAPVRRSGAV